ncbi:hypothetical protein NC653_034019 [Populus alba x Populus x berolinensis]|uniref:Uncharacterized protein n=1 Tax=Populus alba x Populus x berolinensis TaxID=444605 RepID=A0AAD6Q1L4_9ROSI|nr:hypothetical protein NC653_034019 [Populus alba x Populus x berolinensis]
MVVLVFCRSVLAAFSWAPKETTPTTISMLMPWIPSIWVRFSPRMLGLLM